MGRECFEALSEHDCQQIYDNHQRELIETAKHNFQELLLEHADLFYHFKSIEPSGTITQNDIKDITDVLQEDLRFVGKLNYIVSKSSIVFILMFQI